MRTGRRGLLVALSIFWTRWGHQLAIAILLVNMIGDLRNAIFRHDLRTLIGIPIAAAMIGYLAMPEIGRSPKRQS